jgi:ABC-type transport system involved in cytochrome c biogenesis permease component
MGLVGWVILVIVVFVIVLVGGIVLPIVVPVIIDYTQSNQAIITTGSPFFQLMADWWPLILPAVIVTGIIVFVMSKRGTGGG